MTNDISAKSGKAARALRWAGFGGLIVAAGLLSGCYTGYGYAYGPGYAAPAYGYGYGYGCRVSRRYDPWTGTYRSRRVCY